MSDLWDTETYLVWFGEMRAGKESPWLHKSQSNVLGVGGGCFCRLLHTERGKWSQTSCLHCLEWPPLLVNVRQQHSSSPAWWKGLKLSTVSDTYIRMCWTHTWACRCSLNSSPLLMVGDGVPDNSPQSLSLEEIHYSEYITLCWWNV